MLTFDSLVKKIKTKHSVTAPWFVTQNVADAALLLWRFNGDDVVPLGVILKTIAHNAHTIEFLSKKKEGGFYRYELQTKYMDRKQSELALGAGLVSATSNQSPGSSNKLLPRLLPRKKHVEVEEVTTEEEEESESEGDDEGAGVAAVEEESGSPPAKKITIKRSSKLKTVKEMEPVGLWEGPSACGR
ncbi:hypothetical protein R1sor_013820 [Riccia sorocarpa]|uniref:Uncharacterized protein n=1 Tax=Riccia sorocarpa TaxID=122646 RepID=A0ABD3H9L4_9MARC